MKLLRSALSSVTGLLLCTSPALGQADACPSDLDGDGIVAGADLALVLGSWGPCKTCDGDVNGDHLVDGVDLAFVLTRWGGTCAPTATSMSAAAGPLAGGIPVTIQGDHLLNPTGVTFGGSPASVVASTRTSVTVVAPTRPEGAATVLVTTQGGAVSAGSFSYYGVPTITAVTPNVGYAGGGGTVTVTGSGFYGSPSVRFGKSPAGSVTILSPTQLSAVTPPGEAGTSASLTVSTPSGVTTLPGAFNYVAFTVPTWATLVEATPDPAVMWDPTLRNAITATGFAWRVRDNGTGIEMVLIPPGTFNMGCSASSTSSCDSDENPVHSINLPNAFYLGRFEVTQAQWAANMGSNPSHFQPPNTAAADMNRPVERVSWNMIQGFLAATGLRLPTEAEWEFAYRAGTTTAFHGLTGYLNGTDDDTLVGNIAWFSGNNGAPSTSTYGTKAVGQKASNGFGLHDMAGNVYEWVNDWYSSTYYAASPSTNPTGPAAGTARVWRGGSWDDDTRRVRSAWRNGGGADGTSSGVGFRVARNP